MILAIIVTIKDPDIARGLGSKPSSINREVQVAITD
jgi:hypothetical protein